MHGYVYGYGYAMDGWMVGWLIGWMVAGKVALVSGLAVSGGGEAGRYAGMRRAGR